MTVFHVLVGTMLALQPAQPPTEPSAELRKSVDELYAANKANVTTILGRIRDAQNPTSREAELAILKEIREKHKPTFEKTCSLARQVANHLKIQTNKQAKQKYDSLVRDLYTCVLNGRALDRYAIALGIQKARIGFALPPDKAWVSIEDVADGLRKLDPNNSLCLVEMVRSNLWNFDEDTLAKDDKGFLPHYVIFALVVPKNNNKVLLTISTFPDARALEAHVQRFLANTDTVIASKTFNREHANVFFSALGDIQRDTLDQLDIKEMHEAGITWYVSPAADLWFVPFHAMKIGETYVIQKHALHYMVAGKDAVGLLPLEKSDYAQSFTMSDPDFAAPVPITPIPGVSRRPQFDRFAEASACLFPRRRRHARDSDAAPAPPAKIPVFYDDVIAARLGQFQPVTVLTRKEFNVLKAVHRFDNELGLNAIAIRIAESLKIRNQKVGPEAQEKDVYTATRPRHVGFFTHAFFLPERQKRDNDVFNIQDNEEDPFLRCGLALAGANNVLPPRGVVSSRKLRAGEADGIFFGREVIQYGHFGGTDLVFLVACQTESCARKRS